MKLTAVFDSIIIQPSETSEEMLGNIVIPDLGKEKHISGTIVSVGPGYTSITGNFIPTVLKVGQKVAIPKVGPVVIESEGKEYYGCSEKTVLAIIED